MEKIKEEIELKIAKFQMDYYTEKNNFANVNDYVKAKLQGGIELSNGAEISCDENGTLTYEGLEIGTFNSDGTVTVDGELSGNQIVTKYTVSYNANGGTGVPASKKYAAGESVSIDFTTKPTKKGANFLGWATSSTATTSEYTTSGSFTMGSQSVTLYAVWEILAGTAAIKPEYYGEKVNYSANGVTDWQVFLNDGSSIYLISSDYVPSSGMTITSDVAKVEGNDYCVKGNSRDGLVNWLTNSENWINYADGFNVTTVTGGPTLEEFWSSFNGKYGTNYSVEAQMLVGHEGYDNILYFPHKEKWNNIAGYWLASSYSGHVGDIENVEITGRMGNCYYTLENRGVRPLVKLPASAKMTWNGIAWDLSN